MRNERQESNIVNSENFTLGKQGESQEISIVPSKNTPDQTNLQKYIYIYVLYICNTRNVLYIHMTHTKVQVCVVLNRE